MGDVIQLHPEPNPIELSRDISKDIVLWSELIKTSDDNSETLRSLIAERASELHDILQDYIETSQDVK